MDRPILLLVLLSLTPLGWAKERVVKRIVSASGRLVAFQKDTWDAGGPGPEYPTRCEIWLEKDGKASKVQEFKIPSPNRRQLVALAGWSGERLLVTRRELPYARMSEDYVTSMRSCLWQISPNAAPVAWKPGQWKQAGILDVRHDLVCVGVDGDVGGGAGYPPWTSWATLVITDLNGQELHRLTHVEASDSTFGEHCLSPDGRYVATYTVAPSVDVASLVIRSLDGRLTRTLPTPGLFQWRPDGLLQVGQPPRLYDVARGEFRK